jgi:hypothetical protein
MCFSSHLNFFLWKISFQFYCPFLHWVMIFFRNLVVRAPCIFWLLIPCQMYSWQRFFSHSMDCLFYLVTISVTRFLDSCSPICQSFLLIVEPVEFYLVSYYLCLWVPVHFLFFLEVF